MKMKENVKYSRKSFKRKGQTAQADIRVAK